MTYLYRRGCVQIEEEFPIGEAPPFVMVGKYRYDREFVCNPVIPPYMKAPGSIGSSAAAVDRQAAYLSSQRHIDDMKKEERIAARQEETEKSLANTLRDAKPALEKARKEDALKAQAKR